MLLDQYGRPVQFELLKQEQAAPTLAGVRNIYSIIDSSLGLTPDKIVMILRQAEYGDPWLYLELAERMEEKDELYQGVLHTRKMAVSQLDIKIEAASADAQDQADAAFAREVLLEGDVDLQDAVFEMLDALGKGFSATEIIWNTNGRNPRTGKPWWIPQRLEWRDPRWFMFDWISGQQLLVRSLRTEGPEIPAGPVGTGAQPQLSPWNARRYGRPRNRLPAGDPAARAVQVHHPHHAREGRSADPRRPRAHRDVELSVPQLHSQGLGRLPRGLFAAAAPRQIRARRDRAGQACITQCRRQYRRRRGRDYPRVDDDRVLRIETVAGACRQLSQGD